MTGEHRVAFLTALLIFPGLSAAQTPPSTGWPDASAPPARAEVPWPGEAGAATPAPAAPLLCLAEFTKLREDVKKKGMAAKAAGQRKAGREEMCKYITTYAEAEAKWVEYAESNVQICGIPTQIVGQMKQVHANTEQTRERICIAGVRPFQNGPALDDRLFAPRPVRDDRLFAPRPVHRPAEDDRPIGADSLPVLEDSVLPGLRKFAPKDIRR